MPELFPFPPFPEDLSLQNVQCSYTLSIQNGTPEARQEAFKGFFQIGQKVEVWSIRERGSIDGIVTAVTDTTVKVGKKEIRYADITKAKEKMQKA